MASFFKFGCGAAAILAPVALAVAQTDIDPVNKYCWQENAGWMNWRDANGGAQGVRDLMTCLSGFIWCENIGWVNVGDGTPANGTTYTNAMGVDFGVNVQQTGALSGFGWGENVGWINFSGGAMASPPQPARLDLISGRFRGYAWGENIGWINLDDAAKFVARSCFANCDGSTVAPVLNVIDFQCFLTKYAQGDPYANCDRSTAAPILNVNDFPCFLTRYAEGCP
jgi:hypothetical protein